MRFAPNDILVFKLFTFCVYKTDSIKSFYGYVDNTYRKGGGSASGQSSGNPEPHGPHWDYINKNGGWENGYRIFPNGSWERKIYDDMGGIMNG